MSITEERHMGIAAPTLDTPIVDESARPTLFDPGGPLTDASQPDPGSTRPDAVVTPVVAADLFSTHTREHGDDESDDADEPVVDLRERASTDRVPSVDGKVPVELLDTMATATEAMEYIERARGNLYTLHHLLVRADILFAEVAESLRAQGHDDEAGLLEEQVIGRTVLEDRWSFEVVEAFDDGFYGPVCDAVRDLEHRTVGGRRHAREEALKRYRTPPTANGGEPRADHAAGGPCLSPTRRARR
jgi:hypothetical protein